MRDTATTADLTMRAKAVLAGANDLVAAMPRDQRPEANAYGSLTMFVAAGFDDEGEPEGDPEPPPWMGEWGDKD